MNPRRFIFSFLTCFPSFSQAATFTWQGDDNNSYTKNSNWSPQGDPGSDDRVILPADADGFRLDLGSSTAVRELRALEFVTDGSTGGGGFNWQFLDGTLKVAGDNTVSDQISWKNTGSGNSVTVGGNLFLDASVARVNLAGGPGGAQTLILEDSFDGSGKVNLSSTINGNGGDDILQLNASNSFSGTISVNSGTLFLNHLDALPDATVDFTSSGSLTFIDGATLLVESNPANLNIPAGKTLYMETVGGTYGAPNGGGTLVLQNQVGAPYFNEEASEFTGILDLQNNYTYLIDGGAFPSAQVNLGSSAQLICQTDTSLHGLSGNGILRVYSGVTAIIGTGGTLNGTFNGRVASGDATSKVIFTGGNGAEYSYKYDGTLTDAFSGEVQVNAALMKIGNNTFRDNAVTLLTSAELEIPDTGETILASLSAASGLTLTSNLSIGDNDKDMAISGDLSGSGTLTKNGSGTLTYNGTNSSTGKVTIAEGTLAGNSSHAGDLESDDTIALEITDDIPEQVDVAGLLTIHGSSLQINASGSQTVGAIILFSYGTLQGTFSEVSGLPGDYELVYNYDDGISTNNIALIDTTAPRPVRITPVNDQIFPTFDITFDQTVLNLDAADLTINAPNFSGTPQITVTGSGTNYRVVIEGLVGEGKITIGFPDTADFTDTAGNVFNTPQPGPIRVVSATQDSHEFVTSVSTNFEFRKKFDAKGADILVISACGFKKFATSALSDTTATYNGIPMTKSVSQINNRKASVIFYLINPPAGNNEYRVRFIAGDPETERWVSSLNILGLNNVDLVNPVAQAANTINLGSNISFTSVATGDFTLLGALSSAQALSVNGNSDYPGLSTINLSRTDHAHYFIEHFSSEPIELMFPDRGSAAVFQAEGFHYTNIAPTASISLGNTTNPTNADSVTLNLTFSEDVTGVDASDFVISHPGGGTGTPSHNGSGSSYTLTIPGISGDGILSVTLPTASSGITDATGNPLTADETIALTIDNTAPTGTFLTTQTNSPTNADSLVYTITFAEPVFGLVDISDLQAAGDMAAAFDFQSGDVNIQHVDNTAYTITLNGIAGDGIFRFQIKGGQVKDAAGNSLTSFPTSGPNFIIDNTAPEISLIGDSLITLAYGTNWTDPGATATDSLDGIVSYTTGGDTVVPNAAGIYTVTYDATDASGNTATQITRTVSVSPPTDFQAWATEKGLTGNDALPSANPDDDQWNNLQEFAFNGDPTSNTANGKKRLSIYNHEGMEFLSLTIPVRVGTIFSGTPSVSTTIDGITYTVQGSLDLINYNAVVTPGSAEDDAGLPPLDSSWEYRSFWIDAPDQHKPSGFIRIKVETTE